jgi:hypothetical protein
MVNVTVINILKLLNTYIMLYAQRNWAREIWGKGVEGTNREG